MPVSTQKALWEHGHPHSHLCGLGLLSAPKVEQSVVETTLMRGL